MFPLSRNTEIITALRCGRGFVIDHHLAIAPRGGGEGEEVTHFSVELFFDGGGGGRAPP